MPELRDCGQQLTVRFNGRVVMAVVMAGREEDQQSSLSLAHSSCCTVCSCVIVASLPCRPVGQYSVLDLRCTQPVWAADCERRGSNLDLFSKPLTANPRGVADRDLSHGKRSCVQSATSQAHSSKKQLSAGRANGCEADIRF